MTSRVVLFKSRSGWFLSPEFVGDKTELSSSSRADSCDKDWPEIAKTFSRVKTVDEFRRACIWARGLYHREGEEGSSAPTKLRLFPVTARADKMLVVHEDLAVTGIHSIAQCRNCGMGHEIFYKPDGTVISPGHLCSGCSGGLIYVEELPGVSDWARAIEAYQPKEKRWVYFDEPAKIRKLVKYEGGHFYYEMSLSQGRTAIIRDDKIKTEKPVENNIY